MGNDSTDEIDEAMPRDSRRRFELRCKSIVSEGFVLFGDISDRPRQKRSA